MSDSFSPVLDEPQARSQLQDALDSQAVEMYEQRPRHCPPKLALSAFISRGSSDFGPDLYAQKQPGNTFTSSEQLHSLESSYTLLSDGFLIADVLANVPVLYILLQEAVEQLHRVFGKGKLLQLEALASDDTVLRVIVKLSKDTAEPAALMRKFKRDWWLKNCSQSEASLVFDYEIGNGF